MDNTTMRFGGIERLFGQGALETLAASHVAVVGLGGVGSWAAEALARSGIGCLTLIDLDDVCVTNVNRQVHALDGHIGQSKTSVMAERLRLIHPGCAVRTEDTFFNVHTSERILDLGFDHIVDAIDSMRDKCLLVTECRHRDIPLVISGGVGGKSDPTCVRVCELGQATNDAFLKRLRRCLRNHHGFSKDLRQPFGCQAVFSTENPVFPWSNGRVCATKEPGSSLTLDCATGFGTASFLTGAFGFAAAAEVVRHLTKKKLASG